MLGRCELDAKETDTIVWSEISLRAAGDAFELLCLFSVPCPHVALIVSVLVDTVVRMAYRCGGGNPHHARDDAEEDASHSQVV